MGREEGGGFRMGNTGIPVADSFRYLAKLIHIVKFKNKIKFNKKKKEFPEMVIRRIRLEFSLCPSEACIRHNPMLPPTPKLNVTRPLILKMLSAALAPPGVLLEMQTFLLDQRPTDSESAF